MVHQPMMHIKFEIVVIRNLYIIYIYISLYVLSSKPCRNRHDSAHQTQSPLEELRRAWPPHGPRLAFVWQVRYREPSAGAAARGRCLGRGWLSCGRHTTQSVLDCGARGRRWAVAGFHLISSHLISSPSLCRSGGEPHIQNLKLSYKSPAGVAAVSGATRKPAAAQAAATRAAAPANGCKWLCVVHLPHES